MDRTTIIASATAALAGIVVAVALALVSGAAAGQSTPSTDINTVSKDKGFIEGSSNYGARDDSGANK
ncbi:hypothetical protein TPAU25S_02480 [Tsukamurella paurometabola]|uniref:DUF2613 domain-containing protein n=1 Tax=Tsukamurella paurometabola (strain ATCC 8368 / DSM 20162 / CCUG 35730 / CIP 100753 / JCM 10117 / KCTC 9821 / NBRC 16120 / NCIMB 702349 / NCTC 13040) TaxID=521096 RepID=D5URK7_TSUPD|nr:DUF2613 family protein [Tsukamurella paurometabola]ADG77060.1 hypothetical protein Tpau_0419 [Tsukamurella paurometabola DSM 20162]SUP42636.1 Uncharacterised protein [Tsukamurella paurometabola]